MTKFSPAPFDDAKVQEIRSMSLYWQEVRARNDTSPLLDEGKFFLSGLKLTTLLAMAEFCADAGRLAAPKTYEACKLVREYLRDQATRQHKRSFADQRAGSDAADLLPIVEAAIADAETK